jgi:hypothetical protein
MARYKMTRPDKTFKLVHAHELRGAPLYHFTSLNLERLANILHNNMIYFSKPEDFNDPFELSPYVNMDLLDDAATRIRWVDDLERIGKKALRGNQPAEVAARIEDARNNAEAAHRLLGDLGENMANVLRSKYRVFCLSTELTSVLMWSHYSDKHRGLALEFSSRGEFFAFSDQVRYPNALDPIDPESCDPIELYIAGLLTKAQSWKHENEYRCTASDHGEPGFVKTKDGFAQYPSKELTAIYIGCNMPNSHVRAVINESQQSAQPIPVRQMVKVSRTLSLEFKTVFDPGK